MKYSFKLPEFNDSNFEIESSIWTGRSNLFMNGIKMERSKENGKPFLIPNFGKPVIKAYPKTAFPDIVPLLEINGKKYHAKERLTWYQYVLGGLPILLLFMGGALGGVLGVVAAMINLSIFRQHGSEISKYAKVLGVVVLSFILYFVIADFLLATILQ